MKLYKYTRRLLIKSSGAIMKVTADSYDSASLHEVPEESYWYWLDEKPVKESYEFELN
jgi:hypothetical protein